MQYSLKLPHGGFGLEDPFGLDAPVSTAPDTNPAAYAVTAADIPISKQIATGTTTNATTASTQVAVTAGTGSHLVISVTFDASVTDLAASDPTLYAEYTGAVNAAVSFYESAIANPITVNISFGWGEVNGTPMGSGTLGESEANDSLYSYTQLYNAMKATDTSSAVQIAAMQTLTSSNPTGRSRFDVDDAEAKALGLRQASTATDGYVGLSSGQTYFWTQANAAAGGYDAVGVLEHEISEDLGRVADQGNGGYTPLDLFRYTAADGLSTDAPGSAAGARDEPFASGYSSSAFGYFSYNGMTVTDLYDTPGEIAAGEDVADWSSSVAGDAYDGATSWGVAETVSATDLQELNVLGYDLACFAAGTRIATPRGLVPVEALRAGDSVLTARGGCAPVRWTGHRHVDCRRARRKQDAWPVRVRRDAFGAGQPARDLLLSPDHAVFVDGVLIPIRYLVNGATIARERVDAITYWHIELPAHDVLLAENLPAESYLDTGNRGAFAGESSAGPRRAHALRVWARDACARLVTSGAELEAARSVLLERAAALGHARTREPALRLRAGAEVIRPLRGARRYSFPMPAGHRRVLLVSRSAVPAQLRDDSADHRPLGVAVARLRLGAAEIPLGDARLGAGWHDVENGPDGATWRWTSGEAALDVEGKAWLHVELAMTGLYWQE